MKKQFPTIGCCGLDCALCPRYYTSGSSRCPGCFGADFASKHPSCSIINCCFKDKGLEVCGMCGDYPCSRFDRETIEKDSFITHRRILDNQGYIKKHGLGKFLARQKARINYLETFLEHFDEGRSRSFFCLATAILSLESLEKALQKAEQEIKSKEITRENIKDRARLLKNFLLDFAAEENEEFKLRK